MRLNGRETRTIWRDGDGRGVHVIDQTLLPHRVETRALRDCAAVEAAIRDMIVRGAPLIGVTGAWGLALAVAEDPGDSGVETARARLLATRPTAVNLRWALERMCALLLATPVAQRHAVACAEAARIADEDVATCAAIGDHGAALIHAAAQGLDRPLNILTHCNAGWLATVDWGTALAPIYKAARSGAKLHVWVDETRPRNQGASLTACELQGEGIPHTVIVDNAGGHLMQRGMVDLAIVGSDRTTRTGDVCNKIGTYLKALAAHDNGVPFYVALPASTIDWRIADGVADIPIEMRDPREVTHIAGCAADGSLVEIRLTPQGVAARNDAFDVTPARLISGLITERGVCAANADALARMFSDLAG